jgi:hypothetical protein
MMVSLPDLDLFTLVAQHSVPEEHRDIAPRSR